MDENAEKILNEGGIDVAGVLERLNQNEGLLLKLLNKFLADHNYAGYRDSLAKKDLKGAEMYLHALKGVSGNLGMNELYKLCVSVDAQLKEEIRPAKTETENLKAAYEKVCAAIKEIEK